MEKLKKVIADHPVAASAAVTMAIIWAYHNGYLNSVLTTPAKFILVEGEDKTAAEISDKSAA